MAAVTVDVTQQDIDAGERYQCDRCPVALALTRTLPGAFVEVGNNYIRLRRFSESHSNYLTTPDAVEGFIVAFDSGQPVDPFAFALDIPDRFLAHPNP